MGEVDYRPYYVWLRDLSNQQIMEIAGWIISCQMGHVNVSAVHDDDDQIVKYRYSFDRAEDAAFFKLKWQK